MAARFRGVRAPVESSRSQPPSPTPDVSSGPVASAGVAPRPPGRPSSDVESLHAFAVGQLVQYAPSPYDKATSGGVYRVMRLLPPERTGPQYRIQSTRDGQERVAPQSSLAICAGST